MLRALDAATERLGMPPPAALTGDWFGSRAVIAPSVDVRPVPADELTAVLVDLALQPGRRGRHQLVLQGLLGGFLADQVDAQQQQFAGPASVQLTQSLALDAVDQPGLQARPAAQAWRGESRQVHDGHGLVCCWPLSTRPMKLSCRKAWAAVPACG